MDFKLLADLVQPFLSEMKPEYFQKLSELSNKISDRVSGEEKFSLDIVKDIVGDMVTEDPSIVEMMSLGFDKQKDSILKPIKVILDVSQEEIDNEKVKKFRAKPNVFNQETLKMEKKRKLLKLKLEKDKHTYVIESDTHGKIFVDLRIQEKSHLKEDFS